MAEPFEKSSPSPNNTATESQAIRTSWQNLNTAVVDSLGRLLLPGDGYVLKHNWRPNKLHIKIQPYLTHNTGRFQYKGQAFNDV